MEFSAKKAQFELPHRILRSVLWWQKHRPTSSFHLHQTKAHISMARPSLRGLVYIFKFAIPSWIPNVNGLVYATHCELKISLIVGWEIRLIAIAMPHKYFDSVNWVFSVVFSLSHSHSHSNASICVRVCPSCLPPEYIPIAFPFIQLNLIWASFSFTQ